MSILPVVTLVLASSAICSGLTALAYSRMPERRLHRAEQRKSMAKIGKDAAKVVAAGIRRGNTVWADGAWGFQWYAMQAGAKPLARTGPFPAKGDLVVSSLEGYLMPRRFPSSTLISRQVFASPGGRIHTEGAGFYTNVQGPLPWVWGTREFGRIEVWRIDSDYR